MVITVLVNMKDGNKLDTLKNLATKFFSIHNILTQIKIAQEKDARNLNIHFNNIIIKKLICLINMTNQI
jgi:hypothetical protein